MFRNFSDMTAMQPGTAFLHFPASSFASFHRAEVESTGWMIDFAMVFHPAARSWLKRSQAVVGPGPGRPQEASDTDGSQAGEKNADKVPRKLPFHRVT